MVKLHFHTLSTVAHLLQLYLYVPKYISICSKYIFTHPITFYSLPFTLPQAIHLQLLQQHVSLGPSQLHLIHIHLHLLQLHFYLTKFHLNDLQFYLLKDNLNYNVHLLFAKYLYENVVLVLHKSSTVYVILECTHPSTSSHNR